MRLTPCRRGSLPSSFSVAGELPRIRRGGDASHAAVRLRSPRGGALLSLTIGFIAFHSAIYFAPPGWGCEGARRRQVQSNTPPTSTRDVHGNGHAAFSR